ncbi:MAG TPA: molecular chaperone HtpG [Fibrobacteraceae bacterium]|nr:molecular chaperone HtpG [Fibrobacteraceae bacterium]
MATAEKHEFQTEVRELLQLMIHSLYSHKEIFLRELVSNAADALDKVRFEAITKPDLLAGNADLRIDIHVDEKEKTIVIEDSGIGMNQQDLMGNLGTIARSGTKAFMKNLDAGAKNDVNLIGQFGVGFYSVFMVANKVEVLSRKAGENEAWLWTSEGAGDYEIAPAEKDARGTRITVHLKDDEDCKEYASAWKLRSTIQKYSEFITHPIWLHGEKDPERLNDKTAIWRRTPKDVTEEQHKEFYRQVAMDQLSDPLAWSHTHTEGTQEFWSLVYIPSKAPFNIFSNERTHGLKLYVKRVFIMDDSKELLPTWLRFVRGVVDSEDLPLNVSREILQDNKIIANIRKHVTKKTLETLQNMADNKPEDYIKFWKELGAVLKEGFYMNWEWLDELKSLLRFHSTFVGADQYTSLKDYVSRMKEDQKDIYYITGESLAAVQSSPHLEALKAKGYEVLFLTDPVDEFMMNGLQEYDKKNFKDITRGDSGLEKTEDEKKAEEQAQKDYDALCKTLATALPDVESVKVTTRLKDSPSCLTRKDDAMSAQMERLMAQMGNLENKSKRILEINPEHPICKKLLARVNANEALEDWPTVLYGQALLAEGSPLPNPGAYVAAVTKLLS